MGRGPASQARRSARRVPCPDCLRGVGYDCWEIDGPYIGNWRAWPHPSRVELELRQAYEKRQGER